MNRFIEKAKRGDAEAGERAAEIRNPLVFASAVLFATSATPRFVSEITFAKESNRFFSLGSLCMRHTIRLIDAGFPMAWRCTIQLL